MSQIDWLENNDFTFPDVDQALTEPDGLLSASQSLTPELVINAYHRGIFPWYSDTQPVLWWSPDPRCILYPQDFHVSRSFKRLLDKQPFEIRCNTAFRDVMLACAAPRSNANNEEAGTWITPRMLDVYCQLHTGGYAHSVECWHDDKLVGGIYGLILGDIFFGESMFSSMTGASKVAMHHICKQIKPYLIDAQVHSSHLASLGAKDIAREKFTSIIEQRLNYKLKLS